MASQGITPIDLVAVNLYPFEAIIQKPGNAFEEAIENIDIGGPSMLRSAAKNHADVIVVVDPADYERVVQALRTGGVSPAMRLELAHKVFQHTDFPPLCWLHGRDQSSLLINFRLTQSMNMASWKTNI